MVTKLKASEKLSLSLSALALLVSVTFSLTGLYFQFFRVSYALVVSFPELRRARDVYIADVVLINSGNQRLAVRDLRLISLQPDEPDSGRASTQSIPPQFGDLISLAPGEIKVVQVQSALDHSFLMHMARPSGVESKSIVGLGAALSVYDTRGRLTRVALLAYKLTLEGGTITGWQDLKAVKRVSL